MKRKGAIYLMVVIVSSITLIGCDTVRESGVQRDVLFQYGTLSALTAGGYDGEMTYAELLQQGDFGVGTFTALDGEMIEVDHQAYQIKADGKAYPVPGTTTTPFAVVTYFEPDQTLTIDETMDCAQLGSYIDDRLTGENIPYAIKVEGTFSYLKTRSVPRQNKPYPVLADVVATQPTFEFHDVQGVMVGFRLPAYMDGANAPGYHFHFITAARDAGGHVLACQPQQVAVGIDHTHEWHAVLPEANAE